MDDLPKMPKTIFLDPLQYVFCPRLTAQGVTCIGVVPISTHHQITADTLTICQQKIQLAKQAMGHLGQLCVAIYANQMEIEPFGTIPFGKAIAYFHEMSMICKSCGADMIMIHRAKTLIQARSGILGAKASELPVLLSMEPVGEGETLQDNTNIFAAYMITAQLGIHSFGFISSSVGIQLDGWSAIDEHPTVPLFSISDNLTGNADDTQSDPLFSARGEMLASHHITGIGLQGGTLHQLEQMMCAMTHVPVHTPPSSHDLWSASDTHFHYLEEQLELSTPIDCRYDMANHILSAERESCDALCIYVEDADSAYAISTNNPLLGNLPVAFLSHQEDALETALFYYNGKAIIDSRSPLHPLALDHIAKKFGAVIL